MKKRVAFRSIAILLATALLLSSTSAYNLLVYANQDSVADSISAIESASDASTDASAEEPNITVHGGELQLDSETADDTQNQSESALQGTGSISDPYLIETLDHFLSINSIVNATVTGENCHKNTDKYFRLVNDIDLTPAFESGSDSPFVNAAGNAYLVSANMNDPASEIVYINIDGLYTTDDGTEAKHKIYFSDPDVKLNITNHETFALFGYLGSESVVSNIIFENINVSVASIKPQLVSVISYMNEGRITNCEINNSSISLSSSSTDGATSAQGSVTLYNGIAAAVADNRYAIENVKVNNFTVTIPATATNDYIAGLVGQNRGLVDNCSVSGISISVKAKNHYIGGLVGYNEPDSQASGIQHSTVEFAGTNGIEKNITGGGYVGGLVGLNDGYVFESSVKGTVTSAQTASSTNYNMMVAPESESSNVAYYGGITGLNRGDIVSTTAADVGFYMPSSSSVGYYGGISAVTSGNITGCVASGSFVSSTNISCYAGGIIAYADSNTPDGAITDCYALVKLTNSSKPYMGAVIGFGGTADTSAGCYWSDAISGCVTAYVIEDSTDSARPYVLETKAGKLVSSNRAIVLNRGGKAEIPASQITHVFNPIEGTTPATVTVDEAISVTGSGSNNSIHTKEYKTNFSFPAGIGASSMQSLDVSVNFDVFVTSSSGDPDDINNPFVISSSTISKFIYLAPYGHYKITNDLYIESSFWVKTLFTGTIDGGSNMIATNTGIFRAVIGTRDTGAYIDDYVTYPESDTADTSGGTLKNIVIQLPENIDESVLGTVYDSTINNVSLVDVDPASDDGDSSSYEGSIAKTTKIYSAPFIDCAVGNSYIYNCSTDVSVELGAYNYTSAFIGFVSGNVYVDNCAVTSVGVYVKDNDSDKASRAVFIGNTKANGGYILNSIVSARIIGSGTCYYVIGEHKGQFNSKYKNIFWSVPDYGVSGSEAQFEQESIFRWGGEDITSKQLPVGGREVYSLELPANVNAFKDANVADFSVSLVSISADNSETEPVNSSFTLENVTVKDGAINVEVSASSSAVVGDEVYLKIYHFDTEFLTYVKYLVKSSAFEKNEEDGYYHIANAADLMTLSNSCAGADASSYLSEAYKLVGNIDMSEISGEFTPIGNDSQPFTGIFDGNGYEIKNLHISAEDGSNVALFGAINSSYEYTIKGESVSAGVYNFTLRDSSFTGVDGPVAAIVADVKNASANIHHITADNVNVTSSSQYTAAVLALAESSSLNIHHITLKDVSVRSNYNTTNPSYFMASTASIGGIGGVVGSICDSAATAHSVKIHTININTVDICGYDSENKNAYAMVNAGALIGTYHKFFNLASYVPSTLVVGLAKDSDESGYNVTVTDSTIMSTGMAGGLVGSTNAVTTIVNALVNGTSENGTQIISQTDYYIGGIAGYIGHYTSTNDALAQAPATAITEIYGTVTDCSVENVAIRAEDPLLKQVAVTGKVRNVNVGGIVGAINGPATGDTLLDCTVKNSFVEGVVTGGIVGSNVNISATAGNVVHITNCDVIGSTVTTPETCYPLASPNALNATNKEYYGVGGIMGTNRIGNAAYITDLVITYCDVDKDTKITNYIPYNNGNANVRFHAVTGGIIGSCTQFDTGVQLLLQYNTVSAYLNTPANMGFTTTIYAPLAQYVNVRVATGGFIGAFNGTALAANAAAYLYKLSIRDSVFDGSIVSTDCIGGAIGSVINAIGRKTATDTTNYLPVDLLSNIVISGSLKSTVTTNAATKVRGGVAIGNISMLVSNTIATNVFVNALQAKTTEDMTKTFNDVYFSSFDTAIDTGMFPFLGYANANRTGASPQPTLTAARNLLYPCYVDVNCQDGNKTVQMTDASSQKEDYVVPNAEQNAPAAIRGSDDMGFRLDISDESGNEPHWLGSDSSIATVSDTEYDTLTVTPKTPGSVFVSIDYVGYVKDSSGWSYEAKLPVGFVFTSSASLNLPTVEYNGETYYLITSPIDFQFITGEALGYNYWLADNIEFTDDMFGDGKTYPGGFKPIGTAAAPFTGTFASREDGDTQYTISGLQLKSSDDTVSVAAIFGYVSGAQFSNFKISDITTTAAVDYAAAVAAVAEGSLTADRITVENAKISGAKYSAGLFGGLFGNQENSWTISNSSVVGTEADGYSTVIEGSLAAAGIVAHSDENPAAISGVTVQGCSILQDPDNAVTDSTSFDNGAAGIAVAYSGDITESASARNTVSDCLIKGEIAAGAVVRTYTSSAADTFTYSTAIPAAVRASSLSISSVDISSTVIEGTHTTVPTGTAIYTVASGGILARVDALGADHQISGCTLDSSTTVKAPYAVGGILGTFESPRATSGVSGTETYNITIDGCTTEASVEMTVGQAITSSSDTYYTMGAGGVIGCFAQTAVLAGVNIRNCTVGGSVSGISAVGGLIGAIWTNLKSVSFAKFNTMDSHFAENCVIAAKLKTVAGDDAFASYNKTTGIIVGHVYDIVSSGSSGNFATNTTFNGLTNQPFFNIYYSGYKYSSGSAYLFGVINPGISNSDSMNEYPCYTDYIYEMNYAYENEKKNHTIDSQTHELIFSEQNRIIKNVLPPAIAEENGVWAVDSREFVNGITVDASALSFDTSPKSNDGIRNYVFDASASIDEFILSTVSGAGEGAGSSTATLISVKADTNSVSVEKQGSAYAIKPTSALTKTLIFNLVFEYSNGLVLTAAFRVDVSGNDYYYNSSTNTYFVFNASNLYSTIDKVKNNADATVIQCYDIFCTAESGNKYIASANGYAQKTTIGNIFGSDPALLEQFIASKHPNPEYDPIVDSTDRMDISVKEYLEVTDVASAQLSTVVKEISVADYGHYTENSSDHFDVEFKGTYRVLTAVEGVDTGLTTSTGEYYSVYGFESHAVNVTAQGSDTINAGFFESLNGATVEGVTFVNPAVEVIASRGAENNVGVLAGSAVNATVKNVSVELDGEQGNAYVMSLRQMTAASTNVGGVIGYASATSLENCSVTGLDVVGATLAGNLSDTMHYVKAGGVVGVFDGSDDDIINKPSVKSVRVLVERNDRFRKVYMSYAGGVAGWATGAITDAAVDSVKLRDVTCSVEFDDISATGSYIAAENEHELVADRIGGVVAYAYGTVSVDSAEVSAVSIRAFDIAGGVIGEIADASESAVTVNNTSVGDYTDEATSADIRVFGASSVGSGSHIFYSVAGGVVGQAHELSSLTVNNCGFSGYVGTYSYDNLNREGTAGGIIGSISENLSDLSKVSVADTTVSGEVAGFRSNKDAVAMQPYLGAAGGFIGKIRTTASGAAANGLVSHGVMSAVVNLYSNSNGTLVDASAATVNPTEVSTNVGKIIGSVIEDGNFAESVTNLVPYINNIYYSSYPQDIIAYGCMDFYGQNDVESTYTDINKATYQKSDDEGTTYYEVDNSFMVGNATDMSTSFEEDSYSSLAIVPIDTESGVAASVHRHFRLMHDNLVFSTDGETGVISFDKESGANIVIADGETTATVTIQDENDNDKYGTLLIDNVTQDIIGKIVLTYSYGLEVSVQLISMDIKGKGTETEPFLISNAKHFAVVRALPDSYYKQIANIDLISQYGYSETVTAPLWADSGEGFEPIGTQANPFVGNYDGGGHLITNLYIGQKNSNNIGFFGYVGSGAVLRNIHIELAGLFEVKDAAGNNVPLNGGITGKNNVGGLIGYVNAATVTNCSVVKGNVIGNTAVGGLIGRSEGTTVDSSFTSTTSYSKLSTSAVASNKNVGALIGMVGIGETTINGSFTFGYASLGALRNENDGAVGGMVGYVAPNSTLDISNSFVGANTSEHRGTLIGDIYYKGMTVGTADIYSASVNVTNVLVSVASSVRQDYDDRVVNPILGVPGGANTTDAEKVIYDSELLGVILGSDEKATAGAFTLDHVALATNAEGDSYTQAYTALASLRIEPSEKEISDRADDILYNSGLFYPITVKGSDIILSSSVMDMTDTEAYPEGMDEDFYGNGDNKNTDLLFKNVDGGVKVYSNIYKTDTGVYTGVPYENGEMFYNDNMPYFIVTKTAPVTVNNGSFDLYRKVVYPIQSRFSNDGDGRVYPLATERQLSTLSDPAAEGTKFAVLTATTNYTLTDNIKLGDSEKTFNGMETYSGYFDGNGYTVSNLTINKPDTENVGFVGKLTNGAIRNINIEINTVSGADNVGALVGLIQPDSKKTVNITNCSVIQKDGGGVSGRNNVGGLIGKAYGSAGSAIKESYTQTQVTGINVVGGLVGYSEVAIDNSYSTGDVNAAITSDSASIRGVGGLVGVSMTEAATIEYSFSSSAVEVSDAAYNPSVEHGIGGLVGYVGYAGSGIEMLSTVFSSGSVRFCNIDTEDLSVLPACNSMTIGVGGLVGILCSQTSDVYSSASVAAMFGDVASATAVGAGGVVGVSKSTLQTAYSSGSTLGKTATNDYSAANYGVGGVIGVIDDGAMGSNLYFDLNTSVVDDAVGNIINGSASEVGSKTTKVLTDGTSMTSLLSAEFGYETGAYPFLISFLDESVSRTIKFNALLSVVAIQLNELDVTAANGQGISMAMTIPTGITYQGSTYTYGFEAPDESDSQLANAATSIVDESTNTLSVQRTSNTMEQANFIITIRKVDGATEDSAGVVYSTVASRPLSRVCAQMLGKEDYPYLVSSQEDLSHVAMTEKELQQCPADSLYKDWNTPLNENGSVESGKVYYRMMGYITLDGYGRSFSSLENGYSFDGNGYSVRNLEGPLATSLDGNSTITNVTFENTEFTAGESLVGTLSGEITGVNVFGTASGNNVAGIAQSIVSDDAASGYVEGCVVNLDYTGAAGDSFAGIALVNNGTVKMSASVGNISGSSENAAGLVGTNNGTIANSFTMGDIILTSPTGIVAGFVGTNNSAITNCYTRCNIIIDGDNNNPKIGSFAAVNAEDSTIYGSFAAGLFSVMNGDSAADIKTIFVGDNRGQLDECVFDKQMSGACFKDDFYLAARTREIATLSGFNYQSKGAYDISDNAGRTDSTGKIVDIEYPQLSAIIATKAYLTDESGNATEEETEQSRMYRTLRSYSKLSTATALVANDNYIDFLPYSSVTTISNDFSWKSENESVALPGFYGNVLNPDGKMFTAGNADADVIVYTQANIDDFYYSGSKARLSDRLNLHITVNNEHNPNFSDGNGTSADPFVIMDKYQFVALSYYGTNADNNFVIGDDIDFAPSEDETVEKIWSAYIDEFNATLNGQGYALSNVTIPAAGNNAVFGSINGGVVTNLGLAGVNVTVPEGNTGSAGLLAAKVMNGAEITNCVAVGMISGPVDENKNILPATGTNVGGLIGETDGAAIIDGCVVSGKIITVAGNSGGVIGIATEGTEVTNCLSTVFVSGGANSVSGGIIGNGTATVTDSVFAGNAVGGISAGNISGSDNVISNNCYYDLQISMLEGGATASNTHYLTGAANIDDIFSGSMDSFENFEGYPVPAAFISETMYSADFVNAVKLASAKITLVNGVGSGTATAFTTVKSFVGTQEYPWSAFLTVTGKATDYFNTVSGTGMTADTSALGLNEKVDGEFKYTLEGTSMIRYIDFVLAKTIKTVNYRLTSEQDVPISADAIVSAITGTGNKKSAATAFGAPYTNYDILCENFIIEYDDNYGAYTFTVSAQLSEGLKADGITVSFDNSEIKFEIVENADGTFTVVIRSDKTENFSMVNIDIKVVEDVWGVRKLVSNFFKVF